MMKRFEEYNKFEQEELRKQGLRTLSHAFKYKKVCSQCGWDKPQHLWLCIANSPIPLQNSLNINELSKRRILCTVPTIESLPRPIYNWVPFCKKEPCIDCELTGKKFRQAGTN